VKDVAEKLAVLQRNNSVELHFVPSHTDKIPESDEIDELAKEAAENGDEIDHDPLISSYKLKLRKVEKRNLRIFLNSNVKQSKFAKYPERMPISKGYISVKHRNQTTRIPISHNHALLNRARSGHTRTRIHLKNIGMESDDKCRHCNRYTETIVHQLIKCKKFRKRLKKFRQQYIRIGVTDFNSALFLHEQYMANFLTAAMHYGCYI
jgi:hypothetical protein